MASRRFWCCDFSADTTDEPGRQMRDPHRRIRFVDMLPAGAARAHGVDANVFRLDLEIDLLGFRHDGTPWPQRWWMRPLASVSGTRCTLCTPDSYLRRANTSLPEIDATTSL